MPQHISDAQKMASTWGGIKNAHRVIQLLVNVPGRALVVVVEHTEMGGPAVQRLHIRSFDQSSYQEVSPIDALETHYDAVSCEGSPLVFFASAMYVPPAESETIWMLKSPELWSVDVNTLERNLILSSSALRPKAPYVASFIRRILGVTRDGECMLAVFGMRRPVDVGHELVDYWVVEYSLRTATTRELGQMLNAFL